MSEALLTALPEPDQLTLLFKQAKQTVLLSVLPSQPFSEIKSLLLAALNSRNITSIRNVPGGPLCPIPRADDLEFAILLDRKDASKGWAPLQPGGLEVYDTKSEKRKGLAKKNLLNDSPEGAGLTDGSWVAFRIKAIKDRQSSMEGDDEEDDMDFEDDPGWNVVLPSFEDEAD